MEADEATYEIIFSSCLEKLEKAGEPEQIKQYLMLALDKTLGKIKEGKLSPAMFPLVIAKDLKHEDLNLAYELAVICAFFHTAADLTDDVEDEAENNDLINKAGKSQAINLANKLLFISQQLINDLKIADKLKLYLLKMFSNTGNIMCNGQFYDIALTNTANNENIQINEISLINERKGGVELACFFAALPVAMDIESGDYYKLGIYYGALAQLFSDYFDIWCQPVSEDLLVLKNTMPVFSACNDPVFTEEIKTLLAGKNDLVNKQVILKRIIAKTKAVEEFEEYFKVCSLKINEQLQALPGLKILEGLVQELFNNCEALINTLYELRKSVAKKAKVKIYNFENSISMALDYLNTDNYFEDTWEVQRWGFLDEPKLIGNIFPPALIMETLLDAGIDIDDSLNYILSLKREKGWYYFSNTDKIPTDTDDLGQLLNLVGRTCSFKSYNLFRLPLKILELNLEESGRCPTWLADQDKFQKEDIENTWFGNECAGVMANLYYGLFLFNRERYKEKILKGIHYIISKFDPSKNNWTGSYYTNYYTFYLVSRLINAFKPNIGCLNLAKAKMRGEQKLNGSWNNSPQDTASVLLGLLTFKDIDQLVLKTGMIYLQETQKYDGSWEGENLFICPGKDGRMVYYNNPKVSSSFCLRALLQGQNKLNALQEEKREKVEKHRPLMKISEVQNAPVQLIY